jgi:outer membrane protein insertion porin family
MSGLFCVWFLLMSAAAAAQDAGSDAGPPQTQSDAGNVDAGTPDPPPPEVADGPPDDEPEETIPESAQPEPEVVGPLSEDDASAQIPIEIEEADADLQGKPIGRIDFTCDLPVCQNPIGIEAFREIMGLYIGQAYSTEALRNAEVRLAKTGFFDAIEVEKRLAGDSVTLAIDATGATLIRRVQFRGVDAPPFESELRKLLSYRQGQAYRDDPDKATAQLESLEAVYEREGYFGTKISMVVKAVEDRSHQVDLVFRIDKGDRRRICDVGIRGVRAMNYSEARDLLLTDFSFLPRRLNIVPLYFTAEGFKNGKEALVEEYRRRGFFQARIIESTTNIDESTGCVVLAVDVSEGPHWDLEFAGSDLFSDDELADQMPFYESGYVDDEEIRRASRAIEKLYETRGYPFATAQGTESRRDRLDRVLQFQIDAGPQLEIAELVFHGNTHIDDAVLTEDLGTRPFGLFETGGYLQTDQLLGDFSRIEEIYRERGYLQATVHSFAVEVLDKRNALRVHVYLDEGPRTVIARVNVDGNRVLPDPTLIRGLNGQPGEPFVPLSLKGDLTRILQKYSALGYPMTRVATSCRMLSGEVVPCETPRRPRGCVARSLEELEGQCSWEDGGERRRFVCERTRRTSECGFEGGVRGDRVNIVHAIEEGPRVTVGAILLKGNFDTDSGTIYREIPLERDDLLDTQQVIEGQGNLRSLNLFDSVSIDTIGLDETAARADETEAALLINVEESRTRDVSFQFGLELRDVLSERRQFLVTGEAEYSDRNLGGRGFGVQPRIISAVDTLDIGRVAAGVADELESASEIRTVDYVFGSEIIFSHPRFLKSALGIDKLFATLSPFYVIDLVGVINRQVLREEGGVRVELRKELTELLNRLFLKFGIEVKSIASFAPGGPVIDGERIFSPRRTIGKITPELALDRRNSPLNPTKGFIARVEPSLVSGDALGRGRERFIEDSFLRLTASFSYYQPLWKKWVLAQAIRAGQIFPFRDRETPVQADELYFLGGVSSVRGFPDGSIGPLGATQRPSGGEFMLNYNLELRYPLLEQYDIYGATFFDAGLLADCRDDAFEDRNCYGDAFEGNPLESVRTAMGVGVRAVFFDQIPVVFDYGVVLDRVPGEKFGQIHFNVGYTFD